MEPEQLDSKHCGDLLKHLDRQNEFLMESYRLMVHELQKLQVEEEMLMHKLYEVMSAQGITKKNKDSSHDSNTVTLSDHMKAIKPSQCSGCRKETTM